MIAYILIGLAGSGKSTWANKKVMEKPGRVIINRDCFRSMIRGNQYLYDRLYEPFIHESTHDSIRRAVERGFDVIVDECHLRRAQRYELLSLLREISRENIIPVRVVYVVFKEFENNLKNRMTNARGMTKEKWAGVIDGMRSIYEPVDETECYDEIIEVPPVPQKKRKRK